MFNGFREATRDTKCQGLNAVILGLAYIIPYVTGTSFHMRCKRSRPGCWITMPYLLLDTLNMASSLHNNFFHLVTLKSSILLENITIFVIWRRVVLGVSLRSDMRWGIFALWLSWRCGLRHVPRDGSTPSFNWRDIAIAEFSTSRLKTVKVLGPRLCAGLEAFLWSWSMLLNT